jgi:hypothetical protein
LNGLEVFEIHPRDISAPLILHWRSAFVDLERQP